MVKETITMNINITFEFDDTQTTAVDAIDKINYFAKAAVELDDPDINILGVDLETQE